MRRGAGTKSRIAFNLTGEKGTTGNREMFDGVREVCVRVCYKVTNKRIYFMPIDRL